jgi:hypothetical protein
MFYLRRALGYAAEPEGCGDGDDKRILGKMPVRMEVEIFEIIPTSKNNTK